MCFHLVGSYMICQAEWSKMLGGCPTKAQSIYNLLRRVRPHWQEMIWNMFIQICILWSLSFSQTSLEAMAFQFPSMDDDWCDWGHSHLSFYPIFFDVRTKQVHGVQVAQQSKKIPSTLLKQFQTYKHTKSCALLNSSTSKLILPISDSIPSPLTHTWGPGSFHIFGCQESSQNIWSMCHHLQSRSLLLGKKRWDFGFYPSTGHTGQFFS